MFRAVLLAIFLNLAIFSQAKASQPDITDGDAVENERTVNASAILFQIHPRINQSVSRQEFLIAGGSGGATTGGGTVPDQETTDKTMVSNSKGITPTASAASGPPTLRPSIQTLDSQSSQTSDQSQTSSHAAMPNQTPPKTAPVSNVLAPEGDKRRGYPAPYDPVFPSTEFVGSAGTLPIGVPDSDPIYPLEKAIYKACPLLRKARIKIYGWADPGANWSTSRHSNIPLSYAVIPRHLEMDQTVIRAERVLDTVQTEHNDWGFRTSFVYGIDYRYTTAAGWFPASKELFSKNSIYGADPVECYGLWYTPKVAQGLVVKFGRYISPPDIEAQLAPDNYLYSHSLMFTYDNYTQTGVLSTIKLSDQWVVQGGVHAGDDMAPWTRGAIPSGEAFVRWTGKRNKDSIYAGINSFNDGHYRLAAYKNGVHGHDNLQQQNVTWSHKFNDRVHTATEGYYIWQINALSGGSVIDGPPRPVFTNVGPGKFLHGLSSSYGFVNYTNFKITNKDYITIRPIDFLGDPRGQRTGFATTYASWTIGWCHRFNDLLFIRPEIRYERSLGHRNGSVVTPYDDGAREYQFTISADLIQRF